MSAGRFLARRLLALDLLQWRYKTPTITTAKGAVSLSHLKPADLAAIAAQFPEERARTAERLTAVSNEAIDLFSPSAVPVFRIGPSGRPEFEGSGVLLSRGGSRYLFSAAHVFDACNRRPILLDHGIGPLANEPYVTNPPAGETRDADTFDIGAVLLTQEEITALGPARFYPLTDDAEPANRDLTLFVLVGFPARLQEFDRLANRHVIQHRVMRLGYAEERAYQLTGLHPDTHLLLGYRERNIVENEQRGAPVHVRGTSGGGVWRLEFAPTGDLLAEPYFEGILTEWPVRFRPSLMVTRTYVLNSFLEMNQLW